MIYDLLSQEEMDTSTVASMKAQQMDHHIHNLNLTKYRAMVADPNCPADMKAKCEREIPILISRIDEVEAIVKATAPHMPTKTVCDAILLKLNAV